MTPAVKRMPRQKPGRSFQAYGTPPIFLEAVKARLGIASFTHDLAATKENAVASLYYDLEMDALHADRSWQFNGWSWLNPPFADIEPWVAKARREALKGARIAMLVPAAVGANWFRDYVHRRSRVLFLNGRLTFVGQTQGYPKDCALLLYDTSGKPGYEIWSWRERKVAAA